MKQVRVKVLTDEQRKAIQSLTSPDQIPLEERRRQYMAIGRAMKSGKDLPEGLVQKWNATGKDSMKKPLGSPLLFELGFEVRVPEVLPHRPDVPEYEGRVLLGGVSA